MPRFARPGRTLSTVPFRRWSRYGSGRIERGLGGSGAYALLRGDDSVSAELDLGVGWQDPAIVFESRLCVWKSGPRPQLELKRDGQMLAGRMALLWTGVPHDTPEVVEVPRDYDLIEQAGRLARYGVVQESLDQVAAGVRASYQVQLGEGMTPLPEVANALACKYCGGGWGGYAVYLFPDQTARDAFATHPDAVTIEPYLRSV